MPRLARIDVPDYWYHVTARGQRREDLFIDDRDRTRFLTIINEALVRNHADIAACCLMTNHVHLLIFRRQRSLGLVFRQAFAEYARYFNQRHRKVGYVFQGRFSSKLILSDAYLAAVLRYIHMNPVEAGIVKKPDQYRWSSDLFYRRGYAMKWIHLVRAPGFEGKQGLKHYVELMASSSEDADFPSFGQFIGTREEVRQLDRRKRGRTRWLRRERREVPNIKERLVHLLRLYPIRDDELVRQNTSRAVLEKRRNLMAILYEEGYPPSEIAALFKRSHSTVIWAYQHSKRMSRTT